MLSSVQHMQHMLQHSMYAFIYIRFLEAHTFTPPITWFLLHRLELLECFKINYRTYPCLVAQIYNTFSLSFDWKASWEQGHDAFCLGFCRLLITVYTLDQMLIIFQIPLTKAAFLLVLCSFFLRVLNNWNSNFEYELPEGMINALWF